LNEAFLKVLARAQELEWVKVGQITVAVDGTKVYAAVEKASHHRALEELEKKPQREPPVPQATMAEVMKHRLRSDRALPSAELEPIS
jgi:hypothetical protein